MATQPGSLLVPTTETPSLTRSRSSTAPSKQQYPTLSLSATHPESEPRPNSFLSPIEVKPRPSQTLPDATSSARLHLPITSVLQRSDQEHRSHSRHRHTKSDVHGGAFRSHRRDKSEGLPRLTAGIAAERDRRAEQAKLSNDIWGARADELRRIASNRSHQARTGASGFEETSSVRRANSDPKRRPQPSTKSQIEILLDRAEARKMVNRAAASQKDVDRVRRINAEAEEELTKRLAAVNKTSVDITRRLDYTYYNLLEKVGNLVAVVQSFHSLSTQNKDLIANFAKEASTLERDVNLKVATFRSSFDERAIRVKHLEERGARANIKARDLGARLENARQKVENLEKKEGAERRRRSWFWRSIWTVCTIVAVLVFLSLTWREWQSEAEIVRMAFMDDDGDGRFGGRNHSLILDGDAVDRLGVPADVKSVLSGVAERRRSRPVSSRPLPTAMARTEEDCSQMKEEDRRMRALDEL
jgi:hypothetical protein